MEEGKIKVEYDVYVHQTHKAICLRWHDIEDDIYFPKSMCTINTKDSTIEMPTWMYNQKLKPHDK